MAKTKTIVTDNSDYEIRQSPVDEIFRVWKKVTYLNLGWMTHEEVVERDMYNPTQWVTVGSFATLKDAKAFVSAQ